MPMSRCFVQGNVMRVAIMQPTYLPWSGYFGLMDAVDVFVLLDTVQFERRSWQQRNKIKTSQGAQWLSVPVLSKGKRDQRICDVEIDKSSGFSRAHRRSIEMSYSKTIYFKKYANTFLPLLCNPNLLLAELTIDLIHNIKARLGISTKLIRASELNGEGSKSDLLASLCQQLGASSYVSPPGSKEYLCQSEAFDEIGVPLRYFHFSHPEYNQQFDGFLPYLSVVDMLFNCGEQSLDLIKNASVVRQ